ncbi:hypothetical protein J7M02_02745 [Candidatus Aerophobetes bacterium]|nr:hypothetical protein [Candidatus Aerophobetes bacterium]
MLFIGIDLGTGGVRTVVCDEMLEKVPSRKRALLSKGKLEKKNILLSS